MEKDEVGNFFPWVQPQYGHDAYEKPVILEDGYRLLEKGELIELDDKVFDVYAGWMFSDGWHARHNYVAQSEGRWTAWARKV